MKAAATATMAATRRRRPAAKEEAAPTTTTATKGKRAPELAPPLSTVGEYLVVPVYTTATDEFVHYLYLKRHDTRREDDSMPAGRTLFVTNVPPTATRSAFERLFAECGVVETVEFGRLHDAAEPATLDDFVQSAVLPSTEAPRIAARDGGHAFVVFAEARALEAALRLRQADRHLVDSDAHEVLDAQFGLPCNVRTRAPPRPPPSRAGAALTPPAPPTDESPGARIPDFASRYRRLRVDLAALQERVDRFMTVFETDEAQRKRRLDATAAVPDSDGFITVTRRTKRGRNVESGTGAKVTAAKPSVAKARAELVAAKKKPVLDFYRFQMRQAKREQIADLRRKFEEDKLRIERMKAARQFRPY